jgi:hypothetical protein
MMTGNTPARAAPRMTNPTTTTAVLGCHQMSAAAPTLTAMPPADHAPGGDGPCLEGETDPDGGEGTPVAEGCKPCARRGQAQMAAKVAGFPLAGADFEAGVDEEHDQPQGQDGHDPPAGPGR